MELAGGSLGDLEETLIRTSGSRASSRAFRDRSLFIAWWWGGGVVEGERAEDLGLNKVKFSRSPL